MEDEKIVYFERRLLREIAEIEMKIKLLDEEKRALARQLAKARAEKSGIQGLTRKNSLNRVLAETSITDTLTGEAQSVATLKLFRQAQITNFDLKETTFRTYLHRLKMRGIIKTGRSAGTWELVQST